jgi:hypothetical protein
VTPVQFPEELPSEDEFDPRAAEVTFDGRFVYHQKIMEQNKQVTFNQYLYQKVNHKKTFQVLNLGSPFTNS